MAPGYFLKDLTKIGIPQNQVKDLSPIQKLSVTDGYLRIQILVKPGCGFDSGPNLQPYKMMFFLQMNIDWGTKRHLIGHLDNFFEVWSLQVPWGCSPSIWPFMAYK